MSTFTRFASRTTVSCIALIAAILVALACPTDSASAPAAATPAKPPATSAPDPSQPSALMVLQGQVLETTRKTAELAIDQTRRTAETAMDVTRETAAQSMQAVRDSNDALKTIVTWVFAFLAILGSLATFAGYREISQVRDSFTTRLSSEVEEIRAKMDAEVEKVTAYTAAEIEKVKHIDGLQESAIEALELVPQMSVDIASIVRDMGRLGEPDTRDKEVLSESILVDLADVYRSAEKLNDNRVMGWVMYYRALACYYVDDFGGAFEWQKQACSDELNPKKWPDREYNLVCYAAKLFQNDGTQTPMLETMRRTIQELLNRGENRTVADLEADTDIAPVLAQHQELRELVSKAGDRR